MPLPDGRRLYNATYRISFKYNREMHSTFRSISIRTCLFRLLNPLTRSEIGKLSLDGIFSERDGLNTKIVNAINEASMEWGLHCLRYEIRDIEVMIMVSPIINRTITNLDTR